MIKLRKLMKAQGFTLIELLIVIAVIGILAIAVLAALDPIEQLKKSRDTARLADARELYSAYTRFYASYNCYPEELSGTVCSDVDYTWFPATNATISTDVSTLVANGELKPVFAGKNTLLQGELYVNQEPDDTVAVCFNPESKSARSGGIGPVLTTAFQPGACVLTTSYAASPIGYADSSCAICVR